MAKIIDPDDINVGTELTLNTVDKTFTLNVAGNLIAKDGVTVNAIWAKFVDLWTTPTYQPFPFPMNVLDAKSGQYIFGQDPGGTFNGWKPANDTTRSYMRDGGWSELSDLGSLNRRYVNITSLGAVSIGSQLYYQRDPLDAPSDFTFDDAVNEAIQIFGDVGNGNFDKQTYFKGFVRESAKKYKDSVLADTGQTATGAYIVNVLLSNEDDLKITDNDVNVSNNLPYTNIGLEYFVTNQTTYDIGVFPFRVVIDNTTANANLEEIYTKIQYLLRQNSDIDDGTGVVNGRTADALCSFTGDTLFTTQGVFIDGVIAADLNRVVFLDQNNVQRTYPFSSAGKLNFNTALTQGGTGYYRMFFANDDSGTNTGRDYGTATAITVNDRDSTPITGTISGGIIDFTFDYDGNLQRGAGSSGTNALVVVVAGNAGNAKPVVATGLIDRNKAISITLTAETDRAYLV
jgi:hypothetical protein